MTPDKRFELTHPLRVLYWRARIAWLALRWIPRINLGDRVIFGGDEWTLIQGVSAPTWDLVRGSHDDGTFRLVAAHASQFRKVRSIPNYWSSFRSGWRFYMNNWYGIWMREGIKDWMLGCNIWAKGR